MKIRVKKSISDMSKKISYPLELKEVRDGESGEFCGYASVFNVEDSYGDVVVKGAFDESIKESRKRPLLWQHEQNTPIGVITAIQEDNYGLFIRGRFLLEVKKAREAYALVKNGSISGLSIGYIPRRFSRIDGGRKLLSVNLLEISLVTFASNKLAKITEIKNANEIYRINEMINVLTKNVRRLIKN